MPTATIASIVLFSIVFAVANLLAWHHSKT